VFHHAGIKIPYFAFFAHDSGIRVSDPPKNMLLAMAIAASLCIAIGIYPQALYTLLPYDTGYNPYDATHVLAQTQLLFFSALAFVWLNLKGMYPPELRSTNLDVDWFYRRAFPRALTSMFAFIWQVDSSLRRAFMLKLTMTLTYIAGKNNRLSGLLSRNYPSGSMAMWVAVVLATYLFLSFIK
jgi:multicomponent Na+:H+ antiporter subunit D